METARTAASARSQEARAVGATQTGGPASSTSEPCTSIPPFPTRWNRRSTTPRQFKSLDLDAVIKDLHALMTDSQDWWPADFGHYGPFFIRMAWHSAGTYRIADGRGGAGSGQQRFAPLNSWPDNANLDKARRLLWPIKRKYGRKISWADLIILTGNVALESMGFKTFGFGGGREDVWEPDEDIYWGPEGKWLADERYSGDRDLANPLGAVQMGLIYVNPEGPNGNPDAAGGGARHPRDLRPHGDGRRGDGGADRRRPQLRQDPRRRRRRSGGAGAGGRADRGAGPRLAQQLRHRQGPGRHHRRAWRSPGHTTPTQWSNHFFEQPVQLRVGADQEPGRRPPVESQGRRRRRSRMPSIRPKRHAPTMLTTDLSLQVRPGLREDLAALLRASRTSSPTPSRAPGSSSRTATWDRSCATWGRRCPRRTCSWQDPIPAARPPADRRGRYRRPQGEDPRQSGLSVAQLVSTAWASASTFRGSDKRGGANGARIRLAPQKDWAVNQPAELAKVLSTLEGIQKDFNAAATGGKKVSLADLIVLGGGAAIEKAAKAAGSGRHRALHAGPHGRLAGADRRGLLRAARTGRRRLPQLPARRRHAASSPRSCWSTRPSC